MKTALAILFVALVAGLSMGCAGLTAHAFEKQAVPAGPDQPTVTFKVCHGDPDDVVRAYIVDQRGGSTGQATEMLVRGKDWAEKHLDQCPCYVKCSVPAASPAVH